MKSRSRKSKDQVLWRLAPVYDLSWSPGPSGEHSTAVLGEGRAPSLSKLLEMAQKQGLKKNEAQAIVSEVAGGKAIMLDLFRQYQVKVHPLVQHLKTKLVQ